MVDEENINGLKEKDYALYMAYIIWKQHKEIQEHMLIANPTANKEASKEQWDKHFAVHLCNVNPSRILMGVIKHYFPEMYQEKGKSINQHFDEAEKYINELLNGGERHFSQA